MSRLVKRIVAKCVEVRCEFNGETVARIEHREVGRDALQTAWTVWLGGAPHHGQFREGGQGRSLFERLDAAWERLGIRPLGELLGIIFARLVGKASWDAENGEYHITVRIQQEVRDGGESDRRDIVRIQRAARDAIPARPG